MQLDKVIEQTADPDTTSNRLQTLLDNKQAAKEFDSFSADQKSGLIQILGISRFLSHFLHRHPDAVALIGTPYQTSKSTNISDGIVDVRELRLHKYRSLLQITWMDVCNAGPYERVLSDLSHLADSVIQTSTLLVTKDSRDFDPSIDIAIMALGKLGAYELNYSSDVDLIFVLRDGDDKKRHDMHKYYTQHIQNFCRLLSENTENGFLYRVDLNLRPWGRSAPLVSSLDDYEEYYQASKEAWERIAWLRGRYIAGSEVLGNDMLVRLKPFVFHKSLSAEDIERFLKIKSDMADQRMQEGHWNVKLGEGGIRDIEFFVHLLQIVNGGNHPELQVTNTLELIKQLQHCGFIDNEKKTELRDSYLFLRKLENRLQMVDEQQTHQLPHDKDRLEQIARMMGYKARSIDDAYASFNDDLILYQQMARKYFERILTEHSQYS